MQAPPRARERGPGKIRALGNFKTRMRVSLSGVVIRGSVTLIDSRFQF
jgi:hypothetical protein